MQDILEHTILSEIIDLHPMRSNKCEIHQTNKFSTAYQITSKSAEKKCEIIGTEAFLLSHTCDLESLSRSKRP